MAKWKQDQHRKRASLCSQLPQCNLQMQFRNCFVAFSSENVKASSQFWWDCQIELHISWNSSRKYFNLKIQLSLFNCNVWIKLLVLWRPLFLNKTAHVFPSVWHNGTNFPPRNAPDFTKCTYCRNEDKIRWNDHFKSNPLLLSQLIPWKYSWVHRVSLGQIIEASVRGTWWTLRHKLSDESPLRELSLVSGLTSRDQWKQVHDTIRTCIFQTHMKDSWCSWNRKSVQDSNIFWVTSHPTSPKKLR